MTDHAKSRGKKFGHCAGRKSAREVRVLAAAVSLLGVSLGVAEAAPTDSMPSKTDPIHNVTPKVAAQAKETQTNQMKWDTVAPAKSIVSPRKLRKGGKGRITRQIKEQSDEVKPRK